MVSNDYRRGFADGFNEARNSAEELWGDLEETSLEKPMRFRPMQAKAPAKRKRKQSGKAKLLTAMTAPVWKKYKKGSGKKTYVQIRAQVSRSQAYKRKAKKL